MFRMICAAALLGASPLSAQEAPTYESASVATAEVADQYFDAYVGRDWDKLEPLLADEATFKDPTARLVFGGVGADNKTAMMQLFREGYSSITDMSFEKHRRINAGDIAIMEGILSWTALHRNNVPVTAVMPFVIVLEVKDGKVVSHRDYGDYTSYLEARAEAFPNG